MILVVSLKSNLIVTYFVSFCAGVGVASAYLMSWWDPLRLLTLSPLVGFVANANSFSRPDPFRSMLPDVVDDYKLENPTSTGHEAIFYSFYVFFTKFASGVSLGISTLSLQ